MKREVFSIELSAEESQQMQGLEQSRRLELLSLLFTRYFNHERDYMARAGGRINLIGEHVDYPQEQFAVQNPAHLYSMGGAVAQEYICAASFDQGGDITLIHINAKERISIALADLREYEQCSRREREMSKPMDERCLPPWAYHTLGGIVEALDRGVDIQGVKMLLTSTVPHGSGMSNSAANLVSLGIVLNAQYPTLKLEDKTALAIFARSSENGMFAGGHCGFLDQLLICYSQEGFLTKIDYSDQKIEHFRSGLPDTMRFLAFNTNVPHVLSESDYPTRVQELKDAHLFLSELLEEEITSVSLSLNSLSEILERLGVEGLNLEVDISACDTGRTLSEGEIEKILQACKSTKKAALFLRRIRHQKCSSLLVPLAGKAAEEGDVALFGTLLNTEGQSLRMSGDFQITGENGAQDALLDAGFKAGHDLSLSVYGRMLGGGGGGNVLFFADCSDAPLYEAWKKKTADLYRVWSEKYSASAICATIIEPSIASGASLVE